MTLHCETCGKQVESVNDADMCDDCHDIMAAAEIALIKPLYDAEKHYGITHLTNRADHKSREQYERDIKEAGR